MTDLDTFVHLSDSQVARMVNEQGQKICVFPIGGIREWYTIEHGDPKTASYPNHYTEEITKKLLELYRLFFDHGIYGLISPLHSLTENTEEPLASRLQRLEILTTHSDFLCFYEKYRIRIHFYGDYRRMLAGTPYAYLCGHFERLSKHTQKNTARRLFYGVFTNNAAENIAELSVQHFLRTGQVPKRQNMMELYYGENIQAENLFIGFDKFNPAEYPLLDFEEKNIYFTAAPSFYLDKDQLRHILHDHLHPRQELDYTQLSAREWAVLKDFYHAQRKKNLWLGSLRPSTWVLLRQT